MTKGNRLITAKFTAFKNLGREWLIRPVPIIAPESSPWSSPRCSPLQDSIRQMDLVGGSHRAWKMPNVSMIYTPHHLSTLLDKAGSVQCSPSRKCYRQTFFYLSRIKMIMHGTLDIVPWIGWRGDGGGKKSGKPIVYGALWEILTLQASPFELQSVLPSVVKRASNYLTHFLTWHFSFTLSESHSF